MHRLGTGVRILSSPHFENLFFTDPPASVAGSGLRDSDNLWFDGLTGCQVSDKVSARTRAPFSGTVIYSETTLEEMDVQPRGYCVRLGCFVQRNWEHGLPHRGGEDSRCCGGSHNRLRDPQGELR